MGRTLRARWIGGAVAALATVLALALPVPALAKGCQPACIRLDLLDPVTPPQPTVPLCWSSDPCWRTRPAGTAVEGAEVVAHVFWTDDDGRRLPPPPSPPYPPALSVFLWRSSTDVLWVAAPFEFVNRDVHPLEVRVTRAEEGYAGAVRLPTAGLWLGQVRPAGAWPTTPWGSDPAVFRVLPPDSLPLPRAY